MGQYFYRNINLSHCKNVFILFFNKNYSRFIHASHDLITLSLCPFLSVILSFSLCLHVKLLVYCNPCNINIFLCIIIAKTTLIPLQNIICFHHATIQIPFTFCTPIHAQSRFFTFNHAHHSRSGNRSATDQP